ncbi:MAG TPA: TonB-dependent receptor [bacterium]|nr:TonB-dependent receptor [bacterium]
MTLLLVLSLLTVPGGASGDSSVLTIDEVVVTADRVRMPVRDVAASISVATALDLERTTARTATMALDGMPGVFVEHTGQFGRTDIDIRGVGDNGTRVLVLVDGRPEKMPIYGCTITNTLPLNNVERIEVVRGPLSVLYGSDAMAGVVNIVTRRAEKPLELGAQFDYGSFNTRHAMASAGMKQGGFDALLSVDKAMSDGNLPNSQYNGNDVSLRSGYDFSSAFRLDFTGKYYTGVKHEPKLATAPDTAVATGWNKYDRAGLDLTGTLGSETFGGFAKVYRTFGMNLFDPTDGWHSTDYTDGVIIHGQRRFAFGNLVQAGLEGSLLSGTWIQSDTAKPTWDRQQAGVFAQDEQTLGPVTANAGLRYEYDDISGPILCPKFGVVGHASDNTTVRANVGRGFRYAPLNYTSVFPPKNESLKPEVSWNYELGVNQRVAEGLSADLAGFILRGSNLIDVAYVPGRVPPVEFQNKGSFAFRGIEAGLQLRTGPWRGNISYTFTDFGVNTLDRPGSKLDVSAGATIKRLDLDLTFQHVARYFAADSSQSPIPAYYTFNLRAEYGLLSWLGVFASVENLLNRSYDEYVNVPGSQAGLYRMPGRSLSVGLKLKKS